MALARTSLLACRSVVEHPTRSNWKVLGLTPVGRARIFFFQVYLRLQTRGDFVFIFSGKLKRRKFMIGEQWKFCYFIEQRDKTCLAGHI